MHAFGTATLPHRYLHVRASIPPYRLQAATISTGVNSHNEWDPLEEVIVGRVEGATIPEWHVAGKAVWPPKWWNMFKNESGHQFPSDLIKGAQAELDHLAKVLQDEGVVVRRPSTQPKDFSTPIQTPDFKCSSQLYGAMPRDVLIVFGDEIMEAPMAWRSRFFEYRPYRNLIKEYFKVLDLSERMSFNYVHQQGAHWTAAPKPQMSNELYNENWKPENGAFEASVSSRSFPF